MKLPSLRTRRLSLENLESRAMLATASVAGGILFITGNNAAENVSITAGTVPGRFFVSGVTGSSGPFRNITSIQSNLGGGNDTLSIGTSTEPVELLGGITAFLGNGSDTVNIRANALGPVLIDGGLQFNGGAQNEIIDIDNSILASLTVNTWAGSDELYISDSAIFLLTANLGWDSLTAGQTDSDEVFISSSAVGGAFTITLGSAENGSPQNPSGPVLQAAGYNYVDISSTIFGSLNITGGNKTDVIYIGSTQQCGIGDQLRDGLVDLVNDIEPLLNSVLGSIQISPLLSGIDGLLSQVGSALDIDLSDFDLTDLIAQNEGDLSDTLDDIFSALEAEGFDFCDIGAQTTILSSLTINTFGGSDYVNVGQGLIGFATIPSIDDLIGDALSADVLILGSASINTGGGSDYVELFSVFVGNSLTVSLGQGDDELCVVDVTAAIASFNGGAGFDYLLFDFDGDRDEETGYLAYSQFGFEFFGACFISD